MAVIVGVWLLQAEQLLTEGRLVLDVSDRRDEIFSVGVLAELVPDEFMRRVNDRIAVVDSMVSGVLPFGEYPDRDVANRLLLDMRCV